MKGISSLPRVTAWLAVGDFIISSQSLTRCHMTPYHFPFLFSLSLSPPLSIAHLSSSSFFSSLLFFFLLLCSAHPNTEREIRESEIERWRGRSERVSWEQRDETERAERLRVRSGELRKMESDPPVGGADETRERRRRDLRRAREPVMTREREPVTRDPW